MCIGGGAPSPPPPPPPVLGFTPNVPRIDASKFAIEGYFPRVSEAVEKRQDQARTASMKATRRLIRYMRSQQLQLPVRVDPRMRRNFLKLPPGLTKSDNASLPDTPLLTTGAPLGV